MIVTMLKLYHILQIFLVNLSAFVVIFNIYATITDKVNNAKSRII